jgi:AcrR family transcriptional regulator
VETVAQPKQPRRRLSGAQRRERLLAAAQEIFAQRGYHGASLDEIARASGTSKALIYEHFDSKRALHEVLLDEHGGELLRRFAANGARGTTGEDRLRGGVDAFFGWVEERPVAWRALFRDAADPELAPVFDRLQAQIGRAVMAMVERDGDGDDPRPVEMDAALASGACQALANWWTDHPEVPRAVVVDRAVGFCWGGLARVPGAG